MEGKGIARLKEQARFHEQQEEWELAIGAYQKVLRAGEEEEVADLPLYNRVGDLFLRTGRPEDAVRYYEQAADEYADAGLFNNAIALCNKALRYAPHRSDLLHKLGRFSASQGFLTDARRWYLEFAERSFNKGDVDDAFTALADFAGISDDGDVRELLARKLYVHGRLDDALREYRRAYSMRLRQGALNAADSLKAEVLERFTDLTDLDPEELEEQDAGPDPRSAPPARPGRQGGDGDDLSRLPPPPEGLPGLDDHAGDQRLAGFEHTSLAPEESPVATSAEQAVPAGAPPSSYGTVDLAEARGGVEEAGPAEGSPAWPAGNAGDGPDTAHGEDYVDLSDLLGVGEDGDRETRFFVEETAPTGDEDRDFAELLTQFKAKLAENVAHDDISSHYDLGLAFKDMGLLDEAIGEFQVALRAGDDRLKIFEELGQCFLLKKQFNIAVKVLSRALQFDHDDELELIGVYYHLGRAFEELDDRPKALDAYERVIGLDINFQDVADRMARL